MGAKWLVEHGDASISVIEEDLLAPEPSGRAANPPSAVDEPDIEGAGFAPASEENLNHLAPGCFVLFRSCDADCWAEIVSVEGNVIGARLHSELSSGSCLRQHDGTETVSFCRDQIKALGCERYCWC